MKYNKELIKFDYLLKNEIESSDNYLCERGSEYDYSSYKIAYFSDIHLLHLYANMGLKTVKEMEELVDDVTKLMSNHSGNCSLICGDITSDFNLYKLFIKKLKKYRCRNVFLTLGNHELFPFNNRPLEEIIQVYDELISQKNIYFVHNNLFYFEDYSVKKIDTEELSKISIKKLRIKLRGASLIIFGGIGFSGKNNQFNANNGIYLNVLNREQEIEESKIFDKLYSKVAKALYDKNVIIMTHMPKNDWSSSRKYIDGFAYVSGHNHKNYFFDDGNTRIFSDNQVGYTNKLSNNKYFIMGRNYDWFSCYENGIYEITEEDYNKYYVGIRENLTFNRDYKKLYMIKKDGTYMFFMVNHNDNLMILNGGSLRKTNKHTLEYFYNNLTKYSNSIKKFISGFQDYLKKISNEVKKIGGDGKIHGCIIDVDFFNHLYVNILDGSITPYYANSITDKTVYSNVLSLLKYNREDLYFKYIDKISKDSNSFELIKNNDTLSSKTIHVEDTSMYRVSLVIKRIQYLLNNNVVRIWNDKLIDSPEEFGKLIIENLIENIK